MLDQLPQTSLNFDQISTYYFCSTAVRCVAAVAALGAALATFHYSYLLGRIREKRNEILSKYDPMLNGLGQDQKVKFQNVSSLEGRVEFWKDHYLKGEKDKLHKPIFDELTTSIKEARRFRRKVLRLALYGFGILLPLGMLGTISPAIENFPAKAQVLFNVVYLGMLIGYFVMNFSLARSVFINPWSGKI